MKNINITIIDYDNGNLESVYRACEYTGMNAKISNKEKDILDSDALILPGVGAFGEAMVNLKKTNLSESIYDYKKTGKSIIGICLGMQLLLNKSEESPGIKGLGLIDGECINFANYLKTNEKIPQIQWNTIYSTNQDIFEYDSPLRNIHQNEYMYFVHSYFAKPKNKNDILCLTKYSEVEYCSGLKKDNIIGFQFHPEKSGNKGLEIYNNIKNIILENG